MVVNGERARSSMFCHGFHQWDRFDERRVPDERLDAPEPVRVGANRDPDVRVSQAERDEVAAALARHYADGRLSVGEYEERVAAALDARTGRDLDPLLADLPAEAPAAPARPETQKTDWARLRPFLPRLLAVTGVIVLAMGNGFWLLWLLWPALILTSPHRHRARYRYYRHHGPHRARPRSSHRDDSPATRWL
jgi:hypothetical protein